MAKEATQQGFCVPGLDLGLLELISPAAANPQCTCWSWRKARKSLGRACKVNLLIPLKVPDFKCAFVCTHANADTCLAVSFMHVIFSTQMITAVQTSESGKHRCTIFCARLWILAVYAIATLRRSPEHGPESLSLGADPSCHSLVVTPWTSYFAFLRLRFLICGMEMTGHARVSIRVT